MRSEVRSCRMSVRLCFCRVGGRMHNRRAQPANARGQQLLALPPPPQITTAAGAGCIPACIPWLHSCGGHPRRSPPSRGVWTSTVEAPAGPGASRGATVPRFQGQTWTRDLAEAEDGAHKNRWQKPGRSGMGNNPSVQVGRREGEGRTPSGRTPSGVRPTICRHPLRRRCTWVSL
jgi:hypothetical protein